MARGAYFGLMRPVAVNRTGEQLAAHLRRGVSGGELEESCIAPIRVRRAYWDGAGCSALHQNPLLTRLIKKESIFGALGLFRILVGRFIAVGVPPQSI